jgi:hypothetical protein
LQSEVEVPTENFFASLRSAEMEADHGDNTDDSTKGQQQQVPSSHAGRLPPIVLTSQVNLIQLQRQLKGLLKDNFKFHSTRNGTRVITKGMVDFSTIRSHFESNNLPYSTVYPKFQKPVKAVIQQLPFTTPAEDISDGLVNFAFDVISVKQMSATLQSPAEGTSTVNLSVFLITLPRMSKSQEILKLTSLCHIAIRVEAHKAETGLMQYYNCQKFSRV